LFLQTISCSHCNLQLSTTRAFRRLAGPGTQIVLVSLADNALFGSLPSSCFTWTAVEEQGNRPNHDGVPTGSTLLDTTPTWPQTLALLDVSNNPGITGALPEAGGGYEDLAFIDLGDTRVTGPIPDSWRRFTSLQILNLLDTNVSCVLEQWSNGSIYCELPDFLAASSTMVQEQLPSASSSSSSFSSSAVVQYQPGVHCRQMGFAAFPLSSVKVDPSYLGHTLCTCDSGWFGKDGQCVQCPSECTCKGDVVRDCYPIIRFGEFNNSAGVLDIPGVSVPFVLSMIMPCPSTLAGASLCNPDSLPWPQFYYGQTRTVEADPTVQSADCPVCSADDGASPCLLLYSRVCRVQVLIGRGPTS